VLEDFARFMSTTDDCPNEVEVFQWRLEEDGLHLVAMQRPPFAEISANLEAKPYQKIAVQ
jgi:hypothetical protein